MVAAACGWPSTSLTPASPPGARRRTIIADGRVTVDGAVVTDPARDVDDSRAVKVDGRRVKVATQKQVVYLLHKPRHVVSTAKDPQGRTTVVSLVPSDGERLYPVGRLDYDTTGLILITNDGDLAHRLTHPSLRGPAHVPRAGGQRRRSTSRRCARCARASSSRTA